MLNFAVMLRAMKQPGAIAFTVRVHPRTFPADLWPRFQEATHARGETSIVALRRMLEDYITATPTPPAQEPRP